MQHAMCGAHRPPRGGAAETRNGATCRRAACHNAEISDTRRERDQTARPPVPLTMHEARSEARAGWRDAAPSGARPPDKRGIVSGAGRGGRWAPSTTIRPIACVGNWRRESGIGNRPSGHPNIENRSSVRVNIGKGIIVGGSISGTAVLGPTASKRKPIRQSK